MPSRWSVGLRMSKIAGTALRFLSRSAQDEARVLAARAASVKRSRAMGAGAAAIRDILFAMRTAGGLEATLATGAFADLTPDIADAVVSEAARFADAGLAPRSPSADRSGGCM